MDSVNTGSVIPTHARAGLHVLLVVLAVAAAAWVIYELRRVLFVLAVAMFFAYVVAPLVRIAAHPVRIAGRPRGLSRGLAVGLVYLVLLASAGAGTVILMPTLNAQLAEAVSQAPVHAESFRALVQGWSRYYEGARLPPEVREGINRSALQVGDTMVEYARGALVATVGLAGYVPWLILIPVLSFFLLKDADGFRRAAVRALPHGVRRRGHALFEELNATLAAYIRAQLLACLLIGTVCGVGFAALGVPYAALLGALAGVLEFVPLVGPLVAAIVAAVLTALQSPLLALGVCVFLGVVRILEDYVVYPRLVRRGVHLHPLAVIVAVLAGVELGGVAGIFLAIPAVAIVSVTSRHWLEWRAPAVDGGSGAGGDPASPACLEATGHEQVEPRPNTRQRRGPMYRA
jgi:predicted PurR-regulated permease PerM